MNYGFIRAAACTPEIIVADCDHNARQILELMKHCVDQEVNLAVFPELCLTGATCGDLFTQQVLLETAEKALAQLAAASAALDLISVVGTPLRHNGKLYNCAAVLYHGQVLGIVPKRLIQIDSASDEGRYFSAAPEKNDSAVCCGETVPFGSRLLFACEEMPAFIFSTEIGEESWTPVSHLPHPVTAGAAVIANLSAGAEIVGKSAFRRQLVQSQSARFSCGYIYADAGYGESTTDLVFSGHNLIAENGVLISEAEPFGSGVCIAELDLEHLTNERQKKSSFPAQDRTDFQLIRFSMNVEISKLTRPLRKNPFIPADEQALQDRCRDILAIQIAGLRKRLAHVHADSLVIGVSGGLDSTLALLVCVKTMQDAGRPNTDIIAVTMPSFGTSRRTKRNAVTLCRAFGVTLREIDITRSVRSHFRDLGHDEMNHDVLFENAQARERTQVLMDICHQHNGFVVGTGDLSELALGWATYNGDHMSMYGVNASVPKTLVRDLVRYYAAHLAEPRTAKVLLDILATPVSPELLPAQAGKMTQLTESIIGPYELHDFFLYYLIRRSFTPQKTLWLAEQAFAGSYISEEIQRLLKLFLKRFFANQFKRSCLPDGPKVGSVSLSPRGDWRMPSDAAAAAWLADLEKKEEPKPNEKKKYRRIAAS